MNFLKKIFLAGALLVVISLSISFIGCPPKPEEKILEETLEDLIIEFAVEAFSNIVNPSGGVEVEIEEVDGCCVLVEKIKLELESVDPDFIYNEFEKRFKKELESIPANTEIEEWFKEAIWISYKIWKEILEEIFGPKLEIKLITGIMIPEECIKKCSKKLEEKYIDEFFKIVPEIINVEGTIIKRGDIKKEIEKEFYERKLDLDKVLIEFLGAFRTYMGSDKRELDIWNNEYWRNANKLDYIEFDILDLPLELTTDVKEEMGMLSQEGLDILAKQQEILDKIRDSIYDKGETISELQENVIKITDPSKNLIAKEIAGKLSEINNLEVEHLRLFERQIEYNHSYFNNFLFVSEGKMTMEEANNRALEINKEIIKNSERVDELRFDIDSLIGKVLDLVAKLDNLGIYK